MSASIRLNSGSASGKPAAGTGPVPVTAAMQGALRAVLVLIVIHLLAQQLFGVFKIGRYGAPAWSAQQQQANS